MDTWHKATTANTRVTANAISLQTLSTSSPTLESSRAKEYVTANTPRSSITLKGSSIAHLEGHKSIRNRAQVLHHVEELPTSQMKSRWHALSLVWRWDICSSSHSFIHSFIQRILKPHPLFVLDYLKYFMYCVCKCSFYNYSKNTKYKLEVAYEKHEKWRVDWNKVNKCLWNAWKRSNIWSRHSHKAEQWITAASNQTGLRPSPWTHWVTTPHVSLLELTNFLTINSSCQENARGHGRSRRLDRLNPANDG